MIEVRRGSNPTIQIAVVRRMISIIREYVKEDFTWESQRLKRDVAALRPPRRQRGLEDFMMQRILSRVPGALEEEVAEQAAAGEDPERVELGQVEDRRRARPR